MDLTYPSAMIDASTLNYPIGMQSFNEIRTGGYVYIDKTAYIVPLLRNGKYKFLSRPRRFGKSLFISTLEAFFSGRRDLFDGLAIDRLIPGPWESYPVIHLDFSGADYNSISVLENRLRFILSEIEERFGLSAIEGNISDRFIKIVREIHAKTGKQVVILVDEYDNPITSSIDNAKLQEQFRATLYGFYSSLKTLDDHIKFCMLTGITKYGHLSVFSGLNNLKDISLSNQFAGVCGITENELHTILKGSVENLAVGFGCSVEDAYTRLKDYYDGYHFSNSMLDVYNPFSLVNALADNEIASYWFQSGVPTILVKSLRKGDVDISGLNDSLISEENLSSVSADNENILSLFFQTGYLTIKSHNPENQTYRLGYPNKEIKMGLFKSVLNIYGDAKDPGAIISTLSEPLRAGNPKRFIEELKKFFCRSPI
ncbi:MAG: AAA family ATPase [Clostridium sp.]|nr:AAA family ATPase [Clostridium sp.]